MYSENPGCGLLVKAGIPLDSTDIGCPAMLIKFQSKADIQAKNY